MAMIAVLIPTFTPGTYLKECLECLENQTLTKSKFHVYIALNGPKDGYESYIHSLMDSFTFQSSYYYLHEAGVSRARNFLIENSFSDYVTFIDDDDLISDNYLEMLLAASTSQYIGVCNVKNFKESIFETSTNYIGACFESLRKIETSLIRARKYYSSPCAKLIHRSMISSTRFRVGLAIGEDSLFMAQISNNVSGVVKVEGNATYFVRQRVGSATRKKINKLEETKRILYLVFVYVGLLFSFKYNVIFILTRILATLRHLKKLFVFK